MIVLNVEGRSFVVEFRHVTKLGKRRELYDRCPVKAVTTCVIAAVSPDVDGTALIDYIAVGNSICANDDNFSRREGRLKAFDKALRHCGALNGMKSALVDAYLLVDPDPPVREPKRPLTIEEKAAKIAASRNGKSQSKTN